MSRLSAKCEDRLAASLGTTRFKNRPRYTKSPDVLPVKLPNGFVLQGESKSRGKLPKWIYDSLAQAEGYTPNAIGLVALYQKGSSEALAVLRLHDLCLLLGLRQPLAGEQLALAPEVT